MIRQASLALAVALALAAGSADAVDNADEAASPDCTASPALSQLGAPLHHLATRVKLGEPLTIVALGSSSTRGVGASAQQLTYPNRLEAELRELLPDVSVQVLNRGVNGEEVPQMLARLDRDVLAAHPDLVIWQLGTNAVLRRQDADSERRPIASGIARIEEAGADVVLMDLQYAPRVLARPGYAEMERVIAEAAAQAHVGLFRRFALMQDWQNANPEHPPRMIGRDGIHMTDRGYGCLAADLAAALSVNWAPHTHVAQSRNAQILAGRNETRRWSPEALAGP